MSDVPSTEFDLATALTPSGDGRWRVQVDEGFTVGGKANGGYILATLARAAGLALAEAGAEHPDAEAATVAYVRAPELGEGEITVDVLRVGRGASQVRTTLRQGGEVYVEATLTMGRLTDEPAPAWWARTEPVAVAPIEECIRIPSTNPSGMVVTIMDRTDLRLDPACMGFAMGKPSGEGELKGWISFADGRANDPLGLLFFLDALPPATFDLTPSGWVPTLSLTTYLRARPAPGPLRVSQRIGVVRDGRVDEVCELWDSAGNLVGQATQLAAIRLPEGAVAPERALP